MSARGAAGWIWSGAYSGFWSQWRFLRMRLKASEAPAPAAYAERKVPMTETASTQQLRPLLSSAGSTLARTT